MTNVVQTYEMTTGSDSFELKLEYRAIPLAAYGFPVAPLLAKVPSRTGHVSHVTTIPTLNSSTAYLSDQRYFPSQPYGRATHSFHV